MQLYLGCRYTLRGLTPTEGSLGKKTSSWSVGSSFFCTTNVNWSRLFRIMLVSISFFFFLLIQVMYWNLLNITRRSKCTFKRFQVHIKLWLRDQVSLQDRFNTVQENHLNCCFTLSWTIWCAVRKTLHNLVASLLWLESIVLYVDR